MDKQAPRFLLMCIILLASVSGVHAAEYGYPIDDPHEAAIVGTPDPFMPPLPKPDEIRVKQLEMDVFQDRQIPDVFWYDSKMFYSLSWQEEKAPLVFVVAGTGARYDSDKNQILKKALYQAGFHVILLSSPTHPNFITSASRTMMPGDIRSDCEDLYRVMELAWAAAKEDIEVTDFFLTGYSLGGAQSGFLSMLDDQKKVFKFKKVLMINPPVSLYESAVKLDKMLEENIPGGPDHFAEFYKKLMKNIANAYKHGDFVDLTHGFFYQKFYSLFPTDKEEKAVIGLSFRLSATDLFFVSDIMTNAGGIIPKNLHLTATTSLTDYAEIVSRDGGFSFYAENILFPAMQKKNPELTLDQVIYLCSLRSIEDYLRNAEKVSMMTNEDDFILAKGDIDYFRHLFQNRAKIYPKGGHCGNMGYTENVAYVVDYFKNR
jgi:hypothetical protein